MANVRGAVAVMLGMVVLGARLPTAAQRSNTAAVRARLQDASPLDYSEIPDVLQAAREALAYKMLRVSFFASGTPGFELLMDPDGRPRIIHSSTGTASGSAPPSSDRRTDSYLHYTRQAPFYCGGSPAPGELVIEYENRGVGWAVRARHSLEGIEVLDPVFATLTGEVALADTGRSTIGDRQARRLSAAWKVPERRVEERLPGGGILQHEIMPGGPMPKDAAQHIWIDERSFLPLRWSVTMTPTGAAAAIDYGVFFVYDNSLDVKLPANLQEPTCIN